MQPAQAALLVTTILLRYSEALAEGGGHDRRLGASAQSLWAGAAAELGGALPGLPGTLLEVSGETGHEHGLTRTAGSWALALLLTVVAVAMFAAWHARQGMAMERSFALRSAAARSECSSAEPEREPDGSLASPTAPARDAALRSSEDPELPRPAKDEGASTFWQIVMCIITGGLGSGILCLPWATSGATLMPAVAIIGLVLALNAWTIGILTEAAEKLGMFDIGSILACLPGRLGRWSQACCNVGVWASMFLCLVGYFVVIADSGLRGMRKDPANGGSLRLAVLGGAAVVVLPLCFLEPSKLAFTSTVTVAVNVYVFALIGADLGGKVWGVAEPAPCILSLGRGAVAMCSTMMQCVIIQMCVLPLYADLRGRTVKKFKHVIAVSFSGLFLLFTAFAVAGQLAYGPTVSSNVLRDLPVNAVGTVAQSVMVIAIASVYPIMLIPMVAPVRSSTWSRFSAPITVVIELLSVGVACLVTDLGILNVINGSMCVGIFVGLIPALVGYYFTGRNLGVMVALAVGCVIMSALGFIYTSNYVPCKIDEATKHVLSCSCSISAW